MKNVVGNTGICRLCRKESTLCESHIVPEFLYKPLYDSKHRFFRLSTGEKPKRPFEQKGVRERLLCSDCEGQFSVYERYARGVLHGGEPIQIKTDDSRGFEAGVDYVRFKLFELSLLWRMGVSSLPEFNDVLLGSHERKIRKMLREETPGDTADYGCFLIWPVSHRQIFDQLIMSMGMVKIMKVQCCRLVLAGMCWFFFLSRDAVDPRQEGLFLQSSGHLRIMRGDFGLDGYLIQLAADLHRRNPASFQKGKDDTLSARGK